MCAFLYCFSTSLLQISHSFPICPLFWGSVPTPNPCIAPNNSIKSSRKTITCPEPSAQLHSRRQIPSFYPHAHILIKLQIQQCSSGAVCGWEEELWGWAGHNGALWLWALMRSVLTATTRGGRPQEEQFGNSSMYLYTSMCSYRCLQPCRVRDAQPCTTMLSAHLSPLG